MTTTPRRFTVSVPGDTGGGSLELPVCDECGLIVGDSSKHTHLPEGVVRAQDLPGAYDRCNHNVPLDGDCVRCDVLNGNKRTLPTPEVSSRGFKRFGPVPSSYGGGVSVYESSAADAPHIWHLHIDEARKLRDQLTVLIDDHYQL